MLIANSIEEADKIICIDFSHIGYKYLSSSNLEHSLLKATLRAISYAPVRENDSVFIALVLDSEITLKRSIGEYKKNRGEGHSESKSKFNQVAMKMPFFKIIKLGYEADDIIYSLALKHKKKLIVGTNDSDISAMSSMGPLVYNLHNGDILFSLDADYERTLIRKAILGDTSDNVKPLFPNLRNSSYKEALLKKSKEEITNELTPYLRSRFLENLSLVTPFLVDSFDVIPPSKELSHYPELFFSNLINNGSGIFFYI